MCLDELAPAVPYLFCLPLPAFLLNYVLHNIFGLLAQAYKRP